MTVWINTLFDTLPGEAGRPMRYWLLGRALVEAGHTVVIWSGDFHHVTKQRRQVASSYVADGIRVRLVPVLPYHRNVCWRRWRSHDGYAAAWGDAALAAVERGELAPPEVVVLAVPPPGLFDAAERLRRRWGCRVVVDIQDVWPETFYRLLPPGFRWLGPFLLGSMRRAARRAYRGADAVSAVAERYAELARDGRSSKVLKCGSSEGDERGDGTNNFNTLELQNFRTSLVAVFPLGRLLRSSKVREF
jgi:glycosyltransferase involved in cell wall biosynthesis